MRSLNKRLDVLYPKNEESTIEAFRITVVTPNEEDDVFIVPISADYKNLAGTIILEYPDLRGQQLIPERLWLIP
jgi:hypothetical protein